MNPRRHRTIPAMLLFLGAVGWVLLPSAPPGAQPQPAGNLTGKRVYLSPGHGYFTSPGYWTTQRGDSFGLIEDFHTCEIVGDYLSRYCYNGGAKVFPARELSRQLNEVIVDNDDGSPAYTETGAWVTSGSTGYNGGSYRYTWAAAAETATATWTPTLPAAGRYRVWIYYRASANRATDASFRVTHAGGTTTVQIDQEQYDLRWIDLGEYYFNAGASGNVTVSNVSAEVGEAIIADAVRFGAGYGSIVSAGSTSSQPRWKEASLYWLQYMGAPSSVWGSGDVTARPRYADWNENGDPDIDTWSGDACYVSLHTNAGAAPNQGTGTDTFIHNTAPSPGSTTLQDRIHEALIDDIRNAWDAGWTDRGQKTANFGEVRECDAMAATLIELAFHDTQTPDNAYLQDDDFRRISARAIYKGIVRYFNGIGAAILPMPPTGLRTIGNGDGTIQVSWTAPSDPLEGALAAATSYKIYRSTDGLSFDNGTNVGNVTTATVAGLTSGAVYYFQVTALNSAGESFPTEVLGARANLASAAQILVVNGFDRVDRSVTERNNENTHDYIRRYAAAISAAGGGVYTLDAASNEAVASGTVNLAAYQAVLWILGEESSADETFSSTEQTAVTNYLAGGGALFVSGAEIGWDLDNLGSAADRSFYNTQLKASYVNDDANVYNVSGVPGGLFNGLSGLTFDNGSWGTYDVNYPDSIAPLGGSVAAMSYDGAAFTAGVVFSGAYKLVHFGFPFETMYPAATRYEVMDRILDFLAPLPPPPPPTISAAPPANGVEGVAYSQVIALTGGTSPFAWVVSAGSLPTGLLLDPGTGTIAGTPTAGGLSSFTLQVTDSFLPPQQDTQDLSIEIAPPLAISTTALPDGQDDTVYSAQLVASGGNAPLAWSVIAGALPPGLILTAETGAISGTPTASGTSGFTAQVTDSTSPVAQTTTQALSIDIATAGGGGSSSSSSSSSSGGSSSGSSSSSSGGSSSSSGGGSSGGGGGGGGCFLHSASARTP